MPPERWEKIKDLVGRALAMSQSERDVFLKTEAAGDDQLRTEAEALISQKDRVGNFLGQPLFGNLGAQVFPSSESETLGGFRISKLLGSGGMGRVYQALELANNREVALKVLNANFSLDRHDVARFEREAWIGGRLKHPYIVAAYGQGEIAGLYCIWMELLEGPSLAVDILLTKAEWEQGSDENTKAERIQRMVRLFAELSDAVQHVHDNGIIHRDIKPHNLLFTAGGRKLLLSDFGLARDEDLSRLTRSGDLFGTIRYMSPEQLSKGEKAVDRRTDIWSLGVSLYEAVTLDLPYEGRSEPAYISAVSATEPQPARARNAQVPRDLETVLIKCLEKDPRDRYESAAELAADLRRLMANQPIVARRPGVAVLLRRFVISNQKQIMAATITAALLVVMLAAGYWFVFRPNQSPRLIMKPFTALPGGEYEPRFSPDGKQIAFIWGKEKERTFSIYVQKIDRSGMRRITTPDDASEGSAVWSPNGKSIAFLRTTLSLERGSVYVQPLAGGSERRVTDIVPLEHMSLRRLDWSPDGKYLALADAIGPGKPLAIFLVSLNDGKRVQITRPTPGTQGDAAPAFSPDGKTLTFLRFEGSNIDDVYALPMNSNSSEIATPRQITRDNSFIADYAWMPNGRELAVNSQRSGSINVWIMPLDGGSARMTDGVASGAHFIAVCPTGHLAALSFWSADTNIWSATPVPDHPENAGFNEVIGSTMDDRSGQYSPDGKQVVFRSNQSGSDEIWLSDADGRNQIQLTSFQGPLTGTPRWSMDGSQIAFDSRPKGHGDIFVVSAKGGQSRRITTGGGDNVVPSWSHDGKFIYFASNRSGDRQVWKVGCDGESSTNPAIQVTHDGGFTAFESPDGKWLYYAKGREMPGIWKIMVGGGEESLVVPELQTGFWGYWTVGSKALYYISCDNSGHCAINSHSLDDGKSKVLALLPLEPPFSDSALSITRDAKTFLFPQVNHAQSNILLGLNFR